MNRMKTRHLVESVKNLKRNSWMTFASVSAVSVTLIMLGLFILVSMNISHMADKMENNVEIHVLIDKAATPEEIEMLGTALSGMENVESVDFSSKDEELQKQMEALGDDGDVLTLYEQDNPLHDVYIVKLTDPTLIAETAEVISAMPSVYTVNYGEGYVEDMFAFTDTARTVTFALIVAMVFTTTFMISNTIKITILARKREIEIMRLVGATNQFIRWPFFLEGMWLGILGSIVPSVILGFGYYYLCEVIVPASNAAFMSVMPYNPTVFYVGGILVVAGAVIGIVASLMSIRKHLRV